MTTTGKTITTLTAQETLDAWKDALRNSLALVETYELSASDIEEERAGELPRGLWSLASAIGEEMYMRRSWTLSFPRGPVELTEPFPLTEEGESLFGLIEELIKLDDGQAQQEHDLAYGGGRRPRLSRKADYSRESGWAWKEKDGYLYGEPS